MAETNRSKWKFWGSIIVAGLGAYATVMSTVIQVYGAKEDSLKVLVSQINDHIIPDIQEILDKHDTKLDKLTDKISDLKERASKLEGLLSARPARIRRERVAAMPKSSPPEPKLEKLRIKKRSLPKLDLQQMLK